jgi:hypothetical protein
MPKSFLQLRKFSSRYSDCTGRDENSPQRRGRAEKRIFDKKIFRTLRTLCLYDEISLIILVAALPR